MQSQHAITATTMKQHIKQHNNYMHVGNNNNNMGRQHVEQHV